MLQIIFEQAIQRQPASKQEMKTDDEPAALHHLYACSLPVCEMKYKLNGGHNLSYESLTSVP